MPKYKPDEVETSTEDGFKELNRTTEPCDCNVGCKEVYTKITYEYNGFTCRRTIHPKIHQRVYWHPDNIIDFDKLKE